MATRCIEVDDLFRLSLVGDAQISPDGKKIAYVVRKLDRDTDEYVGNIWLWENGETRQYTTGAKDSTPRWSPDGQWLAFLSGRDGKKQIFLMPTSGGEPRKCTDRPRGAGTPVWSPDSRRIAFNAPVSTTDDAPPEEDEKPRIKVIDRLMYKFDGMGFVHDMRMHIFSVDIETQEEIQVTEGDFDDGAPAWSPQGTHLAFDSNRNSEWDLESTSDIWIVPCEGGSPRRVTDERGSWHSPIFSPDGSQLAFVGFAISEDEEPTWYPQLWTVSRGGGKPRNVLEGTDLAVGNSVTSDWSLGAEDTLAWEENGIFFLVSERGTCNVMRWDEGIHPVTEGCHHVMDFSVTAQGVAHTVSDSFHPAEIALIPGPRGKNRYKAVVTEHNAAVLGEATPVRPEKIGFVGAHGEEIDGWLMKPAHFVEGRLYPLIVYIHGGPVGAFGESFFHEFQNLAGEGFGVFYCNPHGGSSYGQTFQSSIIGGWGTLDYEDMMAAVEYVSQVPWVDAHRLGVAGGSYGGFMVNWLTSHTDCFAAAVTERSVCNHVSQGGTSDMAATRSRRLGATPEGDPERLWAQSPLKYVANVRTPTLVLHSERDDRCPVEQGEQWFAALRRMRVPTRFIRFPEESHGLSRGGKPSRRAARLGYIAGWFKTYL
ncbi:MAG: S9 family peptidase [Chloroflexota bacterium]